MFRNPTADLIVVLVIVLLFFGPKRLPGLGRSIGSGIREFKDGLSSGSDESDDDETREQLAPHASETPTSGTSQVGAEHRS